MIFPHIINVNSDSITGDFETINTVNDPPIFTEWYETATKIPPDEDILFFAIINDPDNSSDELSITLYYSNDSFVANNQSAAMVYSNEPSFRHFNFTYFFIGQPLGTVLQYYFQAADGGTPVKKPLVTFFEVEWGIGAVTDELPVNERRVGVVSEIIIGGEDKEERRITDFILLILLFIIITALVQQERKSKGSSPIKPRKGKGLGKSRASSITMSTITSRKAGKKLPSSIKNMYTRYTKKTQIKKSKSLKNITNIRNRKKK